ncbi:HEPN domain-containing protein [archaeon]|jgi:uncharacterized protein (UPF0332 family)|nr:HEPN domain-containing protein [archaeon]MBT4351518.1 HEPN domain-containing protein [archaeon]MBT4648639.1 HEPN domain-containing protein [archaeon]MBT6822504.1 HEPN domain-containing protein [archaeon]MBT7392178.1 HEPN domain-containing protein [archaeon]
MDKIDKIKWCFKLKNGLKLKEKNIDISNSYIEESLKTLIKIKTLIEQKDYLWASVMIYYSEYYALYAFLSAIGIKSENHECSISLCEKLLGKESIKIINEHKKKRIDAQYYLKYVDDDKLQENYKQCKEFILDFKEKINQLNKISIDSYLLKIKDLLK